MLADALGGSARDPDRRFAEEGKQQQDESTHRSPPVVSRSGGKGCAAVGITPSRPHSRSGRFASWALSATSRASASLRSSNRGATRSAEYRSSDDESPRRSVVSTQVPPDSENSHGRFGSAIFPLAEHGGLVSGRRLGFRQGNLKIDAGQDSLLPPPDSSFPVSYRADQQGTFEIQLIRRAAALGTTRAGSDIGAQLQDGAIGSRLCSWQHPALLRMA